MEKHKFTVHYSHLVLQWIYVNKSLFLKGNMEKRKFGGQYITVIQLSKSWVELSVY